MLSLTRQQKIWTITAAIVVVGVLLFGPGLQSASSDSPTAQNTGATTTTQQLPVVQIITADTNQPESIITVSGEVRARRQATVSSQTSGVIRRVPVAIGDRVSADAVLAAFENASQRASVRQAEANLQSRQANLEELQSGSRPIEIDTAQLQVEQAETNLQEAHDQLLNTDLQAYVASGEGAARTGSLQAPTVSGTYESDQQGEYRISLYRSGTKSGYSFRYNGLETGTGAVSTETPQPLGTRGLYIQFPDDFAKNRLLEWVVPIPNTRSNQYIAAKNNQRRARTQLREARNNLQLAEAGAREEQISAAKAQVASAQASLEQAQAQLSQTIVRAPFSGTVLSVPAEAGEYRGVGQPIAKIVDDNQLEIRTFVSADNTSNITVGDTVRINDEPVGKVAAVAPAINTDTGNVEVRVQVNEAASQRFTPGSYVEVTFSSSPTTQTGDRQSTLPLSAVETTADGTYVFVVDEDNILRRVSITTSEIIGDQVIITDGYPDRPIVKSTSGLTAGQRVRITEASDE